MPLSPNGKKLVIGGVIVGGGALAWSLYRQKKNAAATAATDTSETTGTAADPSIDPATGVPYASEYDQMAYGDGSYSGLGGYDSSLGGYYGAGQPSTYPQVAVTNAQWVQAATSALVSQGWNAQQVQTALGAYVTGAAITDQNSLNIIRAALGAEGNPPVEGNGGFPPQINTGSGTGTGTGTTPGVPGSLSVTPYKGYANFGWHAASNATGGYELVVQGKAAGTQKAGSSSVNQTVNTTGAQHVTLAAGRYHFRVRALPNGPWSGWKGFTVK